MSARDFSRGRIFFLVWGEWDRKKSWCNFFWGDFGWVVYTCCCLTKDLIEFSDCPLMNIY